MSEIMPAIVNKAREVALLIPYEEFELEEGITGFDIQDNHVSLYHEDQKQTFFLGDMSTRSLFLSKVLRVFVLNHEGMPIRFYEPDWVSKERAT